MRKSMAEVSKSQKKEFVKRHCEKEVFLNCEPEADINSLRGSQKI